MLLLCYMFFFSVLFVCLCCCPWRNKVYIIPVLATDYCLEKPRSACCACLFQTWQFLGLGSFDGIW